MQFVFEDYRGASGHFAYEQGLVTYNERDELEIDRAAVQRELKSLQTEVISARELDKETFVSYAKEASGATGTRAAINAANREYQARARVLLTAARLANVPVSPVDKRTLNPLSEGRFIDTVYGKRGQFEGGTLLTRVRANKGKGNRYRDPAYQARAEEQLKYLKGQEFRDSYVA
ncbi:MAG: hypothetical protein GC204_11260 [Chloroflexi bacterium]|nr:hypothetical protein [Chloroflexota bacterium]